jgi:chemotaxis protein histidine kinase CheA
MIRRTFWILTAAAVMAFTGCKKETSQEQTQQQLLEAQKKVEEAEREAAEARRQLEEAQRAAEQARQQQELEEARKKLEQAQRQAEAARKKLAEAQQKASAQQAQAGSQGAQPSQGTPAATPSPATTAQAPAAPAPKPITVPAGTPIVIRTTTALSTKDAKSGDPFHATLAEPLVIDGVTIAPRGSDVEGVIVESDPGGRVKGVAQIAVTLRKIHTAAGDVEIQTGSYAAEAKSSVKKDVTRGAIMTGVGAAIGAIAGGGKGAAVGAGVGAGAGTATAMATRGEPATIPAETVLTFQLKAPFTVTLK